MRKKIMKIALICILLILGMPICFLGTYQLYRLSLQKEGFVGIELVKVEGVNYVYENYTITKEGRRIGLIDDWSIIEIPEDPSHTFLGVRSFLDQYYLVREDYKIPEEGSVSCAYIGTLRKRTTQEDFLHALTEILQTDYENGKEILLSSKKEEQGNFEHVCVGYEDCPVGTDDSIYLIGKIDSVWVIIFRDELGEWSDGNQPAIYYELEPKHGEIFEKSRYWES